MDLRMVTGGPDLEEIRVLFGEYSQQAGAELCFQGFKTEVDGLPGDYASPGGALFLARIEGVPAGCVATRRWDIEACEMKRLYVRPAARGAALGRRLAEALCREAREAGYTRMCLDTIESMETALSLYRSMGFTPTEPYVYNPMPGAVYLSLELHGDPGS